MSELLVGTLPLKNGETCFQFYTNFGTIRCAMIAQSDDFFSAYRLHPVLTFRGHWDNPLPTLPNTSQLSFSRPPQHINQSNGQYLKKFDIGDMIDLYDYSVGAVIRNNQQIEEIYYYDNTCGAIDLFQTKESVSSFRQKYGTTIGMFLGFCYNGKDMHVAEILIGMSKIWIHVVLPRSVML